MTTQTEALKLALEAMRGLYGGWRCESAIKACEEALAQPEQSCPECVFGVCHCKPLAQPEQSCPECVFGVCHCKPLAQPEHDTCKGCNGNGVVGNILDTDTCPFCNGSGIESQPEQEPAFHGFMDKNNCCVNICYTPWAAGGPNNELPTAYYTTPPQPKEPEQEPVGKVVDCNELGYPIVHFGQALFIGTLLYTTPPQRTWVGLTNDEIRAEEFDHVRRRDFARAIEAKLKEKNT